MLGRPLRSEPRQPVRTVLLDLLVVLALAAATLALTAPMLMAQGFVTIWIASGAIGVLYLVPRRRWPTYLVVIGAANLYAALISPHGLIDSLVRAAFDIFLIVVVAHHMKRTLRFPLPSVSQAFHLFAVAGTVGLARGAVGSLAHRYLPDPQVIPGISPLNFGLNALVGVLVIAPLVILIGQRRTWPTFGKPDRFGPSLFVLGAFVFVSAIVFFSPADSLPIGVSAIIVPLVVALAIGFPQLSLAIGMTILALGMAYGTAWERGSLAFIGAPGGDVAATTLNVQLILIAIPASGWLLAAAMTQQRLATKTASQALANLKTSYEEAPNPMAAWAPSGSLLRANQAFLDFFDLTEAQALATSSDSFLAAQDLGDLVNKPAQRRDFRLSSGSIRRGLVSLSRVREPNGPSLETILQIVDVTEEEAALRQATLAQSELQQLVDFDIVTGLHSRSWITSRLHDLLNRPGADPGGVAAMFIDLSSFADASTALGFEVTDNLFTDLGHLIESTLGDSWAVAQFDYTLLLAVTEGRKSRSDLEMHADQVLRALSREVSIDELRVSRGGYIGIAVATGTSTAASLLRDANQAALSARRRGASKPEFATSHSAQDFRKDLEIENEIRQGLESHHFIVFYQPQVNLITGAIVGYEALVRWNHPTQGLLGPGDLIRVAESTGLIVPLGAEILEIVCRDLASHPEVPRPISINVSPIELNDENYFRRLYTTLHTYGVSLGDISLELTETSFPFISQGAMNELRTLRDAGMSIAIDDFGTGFAAVSTIASAPISELKLDRSFVSALDAPGRPSLQLVSGIAALTHAMGLTSVAEGIETREQSELVRDAGFTIGQGFLFARPSRDFVTTPFAV